ncbi:unnamed protein product [Penicillium salamii]|nr:unnamed protein product [Penicillium salamii]CAG8889766.1 unnamed protein product [Penicillium salamii]
MHQSKGHSSSLVLTIRKSHQSGPDNPAPPSVQSHGLHTIPSPVASNNAACPRWKIANQDGESTTCAAMHEHSIIEGEIYCGEWPNSARSRIRPRWRPTSVLQSRLPPSSPPPSHHCGVLNLWHRATFIHHGSAIFIAGEFVTRLLSQQIVLCTPARLFLKRVQIAMGLNATWHGW